MKSRSKTRIVVASALAVAAAAALLYYSLVGGKSEVYYPKPDSILKLAVPEVRFMGLLPLFVAEEKGYFKEQRIKIDWLPVADPSQAARLFHADRADLIMTTFAGLLPAEARHPGYFRLLLPVNESSAKPGSFILASSTSPVRTISDLHGRTLGTYSGPTQRAYALMVLQSLGLDQSQDVNLVQVGSAAQVPSLFGGAFDALFTVEPYASTAIVEGAFIVDEAVRTKYIADPFWIGSIALRSRLTHEHSDLSDKLLTALDKAVSFIDDNDPEMREILRRRTGVAESVAARCGLYNWVPHPNTKDLEEMQAVIDDLHSHGLLMARVEVAPLFDGVQINQD